MSKHKKNSSGATGSAPAAAPLQLEDSARVADDKAYKSASRAVKKIQKKKEQTLKNKLFCNDRPLQKSLFF